MAWVELCNYAQAEVFYLKSLAIKEKVLPADHPSLATTFNNLGIFYLEQQKYQQAEQYLGQSLRIRQMKLGSEHSYTQGTAQALQQAMMMQAFQAARPQLESFLEQIPGLKDHLRTDMQ